MKYIFVKQLFKKIFFLNNKFYKIIYIPPCYYIKDILNKDSIIVDIGTGNDADFSVFLIKKYGLQSHGFDPTKKHFYSLKKIQKQTNNKFTINQIAVVADNKKTIDFFESRDNISGSMFDDHINIKNDKIIKYKVNTITIGNLKEYLGIEKINLLKIDIEGGEYDIINNIEKKDILNIDQVIIEFHHHCIDRYSYVDTKKCVIKMRKLGYKYFSRDNINYLFFK